MVPHPNTEKIVQTERKKMAVFTFEATVEKHGHKESSGFHAFFNKKKNFIKDLQNVQYIVAQKTRSTAQTSFNFLFPFES